MTTHQEIISMPPRDLLNWLEKTFTVELPDDIVTTDDLIATKKLLLRLTRLYDYIMDLLNYAELEVREKKRNGEKCEYEDMIDKRKFIDNKASAIKHDREGLSRAITVYTKYIDELKCTGGL